MLSIYKVLEEKVGLPNTKYLYVTLNPEQIFEDIKNKMEPKWLMCWDLTATKNILFKPNSEVVFLRKSELDKEFYTDFDGAFVEKELEPINLDRQLKPLAPIVLISNGIVSR